MLIILRLSRDASTSTHTNCLIQLLKSVSMGTVGLTEAAHSTAADLAVKRQSKTFSFQLNHLALRTGSTSSAAGGESYSVKPRCQPQPHQRLASSSEPSNSNLNIQPFD